MLTIIINSETNIKLVNLWKQHYDNMNISYNIINNISQLSENDILITEYDFLFKYDKNKDDTMILNKKINEDDLKKSCVLGRVFSVPIKNKREFTTFEIPDYILYKHHDHTNYTKDGIRINFNKDTIEKEDISKNMVCFCMRKSNIAFESEYYETNILYGENYFNNVYVHFAGNIFTNKELKYGIIWHAKCATSTIGDYIIKSNNIDIDDAHYIARIGCKYRWNIYLQNFDMITFIRHPYLRFISTFFNKHIDKLDKIYLNTHNYKKYINLYKNETINNLAIFSKDNIIDGHINPITKMYYNIYSNLKYKIYDIENGVIDILSTFLKKYHIIDNNLLYCHNLTLKNDIYELNSQFKYYNYDDWINYKKLNNNKYPNYLSILDNQLKDLLYDIYKDDILKYGDFLINKIHDNIDLSCFIKNDDILNLNNKLPVDFNIDMYQELNQDLINLNEIETKLHYINHGKNEKRLYKYDINKLPSDFSCDMYRECNSDLKTLNDIETKLHYINHGINEKRLYKYDINKLPSDFSCDMYRELNPDLKTLNDIECKLHYINHGIKENRKYK
jgi:hypothetical protein